MFIFNNIMCITSYILSKEKLRDSFIFMFYATIRYMFDTYKLHTFITYIHIFRYWRFNKYYLHTLNTKQSQSRIRIITFGSVNIPVHFPHFHHPRSISDKYSAPDERKLLR